jgi:hypothetical protein
LLFQLPEEKGGGLMDGMYFSDGEEPLRVDIAYLDSHWLAEVAPDYDEPLDCACLRQVIDTVQRDWPDQLLIFMVDQSTIEGYIDAETQLHDAVGKNGALVISSVKEF